MTNYADKIAKIIAKADGTTNPKEAEVFMAKAQKMMEEHGLTLLDLGRLDADDPIGVTEEAAHHFQADNWAKNVAHALARFYGGEVIMMRRKNKNLHHVAGRESARITYTMMIQFVLRQVRAQAREAYKAGEFLTESKARTAIGNALTLRLSRMVREQEDRRSEEAEGTGLNALVPVDLIKQELTDKYDVVWKKARSISTTRAGMNRADNISVTRQTTAAKASHQITAG